MSRHITLRVATYNIHRSRGLDRRTDPSRIADVVASLEADVIALQEVVGAGAEGMGQAEEIAALLGMTPVMAPVRLLRGRPYGNAIIGRFPVCGHHRHDLTWRGREARGVQRVDLQVGTRASCTSTTSTSARRCSSGGPRRCTWRGSSTRRTRASRA